MNAPAPTPELSWATKNYEEEKDIIFVVHDYVRHQVTTLSHLFGRV